MWPITVSSSSTTSTRPLGKRRDWSGVAKLLRWRRGTALSSLAAGPCGWRLRDNRGVAVGRDADAMTRPRIPPERQQAAALQSERRMVARGERPRFRLVPVDTVWSIDALPWIPARAFATRPDATDLLRQDVAVALDV